jgi:phosphatidylglycerol lysyltransferase
MGYEHSALKLIGRRIPWPKLAVASFCTQSIAHSTGFAFFVGATLRYQFYAVRGLSVTDIAKIQIYFTATFTLGVSTLAGAVFLLAPGRLAAATGLPTWLWQLGAAAALTAVAAYVLWGAFYHRPLRIRGKSYVLPAAGATLTQIFWGIADLLAVAAALWVLLPEELGLGYLQVLAIFMASIVVGLMSHVPGSLGVFEGAVILLVQPAPELTLPLIGALLAFRACYYLLPLALGVILLACFQLGRWRKMARGPLRDLVRQLRPHMPRIAAAAAFIAGLALLATTLTPLPEARAARLAARLPDSIIGFGNLVSVAGGIGLLLVARGLVLRLLRVWQLVVLFVALGLVLALLTAESIAVIAVLTLALAVVLPARKIFDRLAPPSTTWLTPAWLVAFALLGVMAFWLIGHA